VEATRVRCAKCDRLIDQAPDLDPSKREPCPDCGSLARTFEASSSLTIGLRASVAFTKIHEEIERHWKWLLFSLALTIAGSFLGLFVVGIPGILLGLLLGLVSYLTGRRGETVIREIEHS
jgi:hypothetical protein